MNRSRIAALDSTDCLVNWHPRVFKTSKTSQFPQWQWYNNRVGFVYNSIGNHCKTEAERERGEVGGSAINVASFLPSEGRQALCNPDGVVRARGCGGWSWRDSSYPSARERRGEERKEGEHGSPWTSEAYVGSRAPSGLWPRHIPHFPPLSPSL